MAQVLKEEIENKIYQMAIDEFYNNDYKTATLRNIAKNAGIPVGLIYTYYKNKEALFNIIVNPIYLSVQKLLLSEPVASNKSQDCDTSFHFQEELPAILNMLKNNRRQFVILIDKSKGTSYANTKEEFIQFTKMHIQTQLQAKMHKNKKIDELFYHILANNFMEGVFEVARHYKNEEWAANIMQLYTQQYFYGVNSLIE